MIIEAQLRCIPATGFMVETNVNVDLRVAIDALIILNIRYEFGVGEHQAETLSVR